MPSSSSFGVCPLSPGMTGGAYLGGCIEGGVAGGLVSACPKVAVWGDYFSCRGYMKMVARGRGGISNGPYSGGQTQTVHHSFDSDSDWIDPAYPEGTLQRDSLRQNGPYTCARGEGRRDDPFFGDPLGSQGVLSDDNQYDCYCAPFWPEATATTAVSPAPAGPTASTGCGRHRTRDVSCSATTNPTANPTESSTANPSTPAKASAATTTATSTSTRTSSATSSTTVGPPARVLNAAAIVGVVIAGLWVVAGVSAIAIGWHAGSAARCALVTAAYDTAAGAGGFLLAGQIGMWVGMGVARAAAHATARVVRGRWPRRWMLFGHDAKRVRVEPEPVNVRRGTHNAPPPPATAPNGNPWPKTKIVVGIDIFTGAYTEDELSGAQALWFFVDGAYWRAARVFVPDQAWARGSRRLRPPYADLVSADGGGHMRQQVVTVDMLYQVDNSSIGFEGSLPLRFPALGPKCTEMRRAMEGYAGRVAPHHGWVVAAACLSLPTGTVGTNGLTWWANACAMTVNSRNFGEPTMWGLFAELRRLPSCMVYFLVFHCTIGGETQLGAANSGQGPFSGAADHYAMNGDPEVVVGRRANGDPVYGRHCATQRLYEYLVHKCRLAICRVICFNLFNFGHSDGCSHQDHHRPGKAKNDCRPPSDDPRCPETQCNADTVAGEMALVAGWLCDVHGHTLCTTVIAMGKMGAASLAAHLSEVVVSATERIRVTIVGAAHMCVTNVRRLQRPYAEVWCKELHDTAPDQFNALFPDSPDIDVFALTAGFCHVGMTAQEMVRNGIAAYACISGADPVCAALEAALIEVSEAARGEGPRGGEPQRWEEARKAILRGFAERGTINPPAVHALLREHLCDDDDARRQFDRATVAGIMGRGGAPPEGLTSSVLAGMSADRQKELFDAYIAIAKDHNKLGALDAATMAAMMTVLPADRQTELFDAYVAIAKDHNKLCALDAATMATMMAVLPADRQKELFDAYLKLAKQPSMDGAWLARMVQACPDGCMAAHWHGVVSKLGNDRDVTTQPLPLVEWLAGRGDCALTRDVAAAYHRAVTSTGATTFEGVAKVTDRMWSVCTSSESGLAPGQLRDMATALAGAGRFPPAFDRISFSADVATAINTDDTVTRQALMVRTLGPEEIALVKRTRHRRQQTLFHQRAPAPIAPNVPAPADGTEFTEEDLVRILTPESGFGDSREERLKNFRASLRKNNYSTSLRQQRITQLAASLAGEYDCNFCGNRFAVRRNLVDHQKGCQLRPG